MTIRSFTSLTTTMVMLLAPCVSGCATFADFEQLKLSGTSHSATDIEMQFGLARMAEKSGRLTDAQAMYAEILRVEPDHSPSQHRIGVVAIRQEKLDQALEHLTKALDPNDPDKDLLGDLGYAHLLAGNLREAEQHLRRAVELDPADQRLVNNLALVCGYQGNTNESLQLFRRVGSESQAQSNLAFVLAGLGERDAAKQHFHQALNHDPTLEPAARGLSEFHQSERYSK